MQRLAFLLSLVVVTCLGPGAASALALAPGDLEPSFTQPTGRMHADTSFDEHVSGILVQADGKIIINARGREGIRIRRLLPSGATDTSYGVAGTYERSGAPRLVVKEIALDPQGRVVFTGVNDVDHRLLVGRLTASGALDPTFAPSSPTPGLLQVTPSIYDIADPVKVLVSAAGVVSVATTAYAGSDADLLVARFTSAGVLDAGYGAGGFASYDTTDGEYAEDAALLADGRVMISGSYDWGVDQGELLAAIAANGSSSGAFRKAGTGTFHGSPAIDSFRAVAVDGASTVVVAEDDKGVDGPPVTHATRLDRFTVTGTTVALDTSFSGDGYGALLAEGFYPDQIQRTADGRYLLVGGSEGLAGRVMRVLADGDTKDATFGTNGVATLAEQDLCCNYEMRMATTADGGILVGGNWTPPLGASWHYITKVVGLVGRTSASVTASSASAVVGSTTNYTATIASSGPDPTGAASLRVTLPTDLAMTTAPAGCLQEGAATWACSVGSLAAGGSASVTFAARSTAAGAHVVQVATSSTTFDDSRANDVASVSVTATKIATSATVRRLVGTKLSTCGTKTSNACIASRSVRGQKLAAFVLRTTVTPSTAPVPKSVKLTLQRKKGSKWVAAGTATVKLTSKNIASWSMPASMRKVTGLRRVRVAVTEGATTAAATSAWRYVTVT